MATIDITAHMAPSPYGDADQWRTDEALKLRMHGRYQGHTLNWSVLYQGPGGTIRMSGDPIGNGQGRPGPVAALIPNPSVIALHHPSQPQVIDVAPGDVLVINGQRLVITDDEQLHNPVAVSEVEAGLRMAARFIQEQLMDQVSNAPYSSTDGKADSEIDTEVMVNSARHNATCSTLADAYREIMNMIPEARQSLAAPAVR